MMQLLSLKVKARMRIGFAGIDPAYNDLIFGGDPTDFGLFKAEIKKYLAVLKEWV